MAARATTVGNDNLKSCVLCSSKYNRDRPSICQCTHCSIALCPNCCKEHYEELLQDVTKISHQYNELKELLQKKQLMIIEETNKSIANVNQQFDIYIEELRDTKRKILADMEKTQQDAQEYVLKIETDLRTPGAEIQELAKQDFVQTSTMENLLKDLEKIKHRLNTCQVSRTENLNKTKPEFSIKFGCRSIDIAESHSANASTNRNKINETDPQEPPLKRTKLNTSNSSWLDQFVSTDQLSETYYLEFASELWRDFIDIGKGKKHIKTCYKVDRMASDGKNILYTSYYDDDRDILAYCQIEDNSGEGNQYRHWKQSRIEDMIWWNSIKMFICATKNRIYKIMYHNKIFTIESVIHRNWSYIRVASNTDHLFLWGNSTEIFFNGISVYSIRFGCIRMINFNAPQIDPFIDRSISFCVTNNMVASLCKRVEKNCEVFQVIFYDMDMKTLRSVPFDRCNGNIEIRTDGRNRFFISTEEHRLYIVRSDGRKQEIYLEYDGTRIAVLENHRIATSGLDSNIQLISY